MSIKKISIFLLLGSIFIFFNESSAQKLMDLTPPSPTAYELGKYGQTPVGLFSGTINSSVPLYEYRTKNLSVPISLSYSSNGIKVDELGTNVGLGWSLSMGGVITRMVRDLPDGINTALLFPERSIQQQPFSLMNPEVLQYFNIAGNNPDIDSETDVFMFNFSGHSGKFVMDNNKRYVMIPKQDIKIEGVVVNGNTGFKITTAAGIQYTFLDKERSRNRASGGGHSIADFYTSAWYLTTIKHPNGDEVTFTYESEGYQYVASQQQSLTVTPPNQTDCNGTVGISYIQSPVISYNLNVIGLRLKEIRSNIPEQGKVLITTSIPHSETGVFQLVSTIQVIDKSNMEIERVDFTYLKPANKRVFLQKISMKDPNKSYQFEYNDATGFPVRLSYAQDHWGYANGASGNLYLFPNLNGSQYSAPDMIKTYNTGAEKEPNLNHTGKGLLSKITYPTKGYSSFTYEPNTYSTTSTVLPPLISKTVSVVKSENDNTQPSMEQSTPVINFDQDASLTLYAYLTDPNCTDVIHAVASFSIQDLTTPASPPVVIERTVTGNYNLGSAFNLRAGTSYNSPFVHLTAGHSYKIKIVGTGRCITAGATLNYYEGTTSTVLVNKITGGMRIQKVETSDGINATPQLTRYYYAKKESLTASTGEKGLIPSYLSTVQERQSCALDIYRYEVSSNSLNALYNSIGTNTTGYKFVTVSNGGNNFENGGEEHEFILDYDTPGRNVLGDVIPSAPWTNIGFSNGKEKTATVFKKAPSGVGFTVLKTQSNVYTEDTRYKEVVYGYAIRKKYETSILTQPVSYTCTQADVDAVTSYYKCTSDHTINLPNGDPIKIEHSPGLLFGYSDWVCIAPGASMPPVKVTVPHPCKAAGLNAVINNYNILENLEITEYKHISTWEYLSSGATTVYDLNGANPITTVQNFFYDNPVHLQLTRTETSNTGGPVLKEKIYYPDDVSSVSSLPGGDLQPAELSAITLLNKDNQYRINTPIQTESYLGTIKRNTARTIYQTYNGLTLPSAVRTLRGDVSSTNVFRDRVYYNAYDTKGNVLEALQVNDIFTSYIWGYNGLAPIAIAKNARANEILFNGFEEPTPSTWDGNLTAYDGTRSYTGKYSGRIDKPTAGEQISMNTNTVIIPARPTGKLIKYKYSCWVYSTGPSVDLFFFMKRANETGYFTAVTNVTTSVTNKWVYLEGVYDVADNITQLNIRLDNNGGGTVWFDDVRLYPAVAQMSTFTFQPLIGITSETLPNQQTKKYEYDSYHRLKLIRNGENAILQRSQYKFK